MTTLLPKPKIAVELAAVKREAATAAAFLVPKINALVIDSPIRYAEADSYLTKLRGVRAKFKGMVDDILKPLNQARNATLAMGHEVDDPLKAAEDRVRLGMQEFKRKELAAQRAEELKQQEEAQRLRVEASKKEAAESKARTEQMRQKLAAQREELETKADVIEATPIAPAVQVKGSGTRVTKKPVVKDLLQLLKGVVKGDVPIEVITVNIVDIRAYYRQMPDEVAQWPGVVIEEDVQIVGRG